MKASTLTAKLLSLVALMLVVVMAFTACKDNKGTESGTTNADVTSVEGNEEDTNSTGDAADASSENKDGSSKKQTTTSKQNNSTSKQSGSNNGPVNLTDYANIPASVKEKGVHVLMWRNYTESEQKQVNDFQNKTGIKVRTTVTTENEYSTKLVAMITGKDSPDVVCLSSRNFPGFVTKSLQALDVNKFNLNDSIWYKNYMDEFRAGDKYYGAAIRGIWSVEDTNYVTYYNPAVLSECGITEMPWDLYKAGKWNWAKQKEYALAVKQHGTAKGYTGFATQGFDVFMNSAGLDFVDYDPVKATFTNNIGVKNEALVTAWTEAAELNTAGAATGYDLTGFQQGKVGMFSAIAYGLYNQGSWLDVQNNAAHKNMMAVPVAGPSQSEAYIPVRPKTWGVPKGAKNIQGAAYFIRYYLDPSTIDMSSTFYSKQYEEVFNIITAESAKKRTMNGQGIADYVSDGTYSKICNELTGSTVANINTVLNKYKGNVNTGVTRANKELARVAAK